MLAEIELRGNRLSEGKAAVTQALQIDRNQAQAAVVLACKLAENNPEAGYQPIDAVADSAIADNDFAAAAVRYWVGVASSVASISARVSSPAATVSVTTWSRSPALVADHITMPLALSAPDA